MQQDDIDQKLGGAATDLEILRDLAAELAQRPGIGPTSEQADALGRVMGGPLARAAREFVGWEASVAEGKKEATEAEQAVEGRYEVDVRPKIASLEEARAYADRLGAELTRARREWEVAVAARDVAEGELANAQAAHDSSLRNSREAAAARNRRTQEKLADARAVLKRFDIDENLAHTIAGFKREG